MSTLIRHLCRHTRQQQGASTVEFLLNFLIVLFFTVFIIQIFLVFTNALLVNHALENAAHEVAARGGVDRVVVDRFNALRPQHLPSATSGHLKVYDANDREIPIYANELAPGLEQTRSGDIIKLTYTYPQRLTLLDAVGLKNAQLNMERTIVVASQSTREE